MLLSAYLSHMKTQYAPLKVSIYPLLYRCIVFVFRVGEPTNCEEHRKLRGKRIAEGDVTEGSSAVPYAKRISVVPHATILKYKDSQCPIRYFSNLYIVRNHSDCQRGKSLFTFSVTFASQDFIQMQKNRR